MGKSVGFVAVLSCAVALSAFARTVSIVSSDRDSGRVDLTISAADAGEGAKALIAAWAPGDMDGAPTNALETVYVGTVNAETTETSFTIPATWRAKSGTVQFFLMSQTAPYAKRFTYLRTPSANCWIDTGVVPDLNTDISVKTFVTSQDAATFGVSGKIYFFANSKGEMGSYWCGFFGDSNGSTPLSAPRGDVPHTLRINSTGASIDGIQYYKVFDPANTTATTTSTLTLFARKADGTTTSVAKQGDISIYFAQIRSGDELTHDYVPCEKADGTKTLYNRVSGEFAAVSGTGTFTAGDEVCPDPRDCGMVESATEVLRLAPTLTITAKNLETAEITVLISEGHDDGLLLVVGAPEDAGTTYADWANQAFLTKVSAADNVVTVPVPVAWCNAGYTIRALWKSAEGFPYDYEVESVYSAGQAYMLSRWIPTQESDVTVIGRSSYDVCLTGLTEHFYFFCNGSATFYGFFGKNGSAGVADTTRTRSWRLGPAGAFLDGKLVGGPFADTTFSVQGKSLSVPFRRDRSSGSMTKTGNAWIQSMQIRERGDLVRDFIPCVSDNVAGLYDRVHAQFYPSATSTAFEAGETVVPATREGDILAWSEAYSLMSSADTATWDAGGSDTSFTTAANWDGDVAPDFTSGLAFLSFASAGTTAQVTGTTRVRGLKFNVANDFSITAADADSVLSLGGGGITLENNPSETISGNWRLARFSGPVEIAADQTWDLSENTKRRIQIDAGADVSGDAARTLTIEGSGVLGLVATNSFAGNVQINGGILKVISKKQPFGSGSEGGKVYVDQTTGAVWEQFGATVDKPLVVNGANLLGDRFVLWDNGFGTNTFTAPLMVQQDRLRMKVHSPTVFSGGIDLMADLRIEGQGVLVFRDQPIMRAANQGVDLLSSREIHVYSVSNSVSFYFTNKDTGSGNRLHFWHDNAMDYWGDIALGHGTTLDLHGTCQNLGDLTMDSSDDCVTSEVPAEIFSYCDFYNSTGYLKGRIMGPITYRKSGRRTVALQGANTATGPLVAQNGKLVLDTTGSWAGTDIQIGREDTNRKPTLQLTHNGVFADPRNTVITMTTTARTGSDFNTDCGADPAPVLELDEGVDIHVQSIVLDGKPLAGGWWGGADSDALHKDATHFTGSGKIYVRQGAGTIMVFR